MAQIETRKTGGRNTDEWKNHLELDWKDHGQRKIKMERPESKTMLFYRRRIRVSLALLAVGANCSPNDIETLASILKKMMEEDGKREKPGRTVLLSLRGLTPPVNCRVLAGVLNHG